MDYDRQRPLATLIAEAKAGKPSALARWLRANADALYADDIADLVLQRVRPPGGRPPQPRDANGRTKRERQLSQAADWVDARTATGVSLDAAMKEALKRFSAEKAITYTRLITVIRKGLPAAKKG